MPHTKSAFDLMDSMTPAWAELKPESMLYIGWRYDCHPWWHSTFAPALGIKNVTILEVFPANVSDAEQKVWEGRFPIETDVWQGNIMDAVNVIFPREFDVIFWDHGPEHVTKEQLNIVTPVLRRLRKKLLLYCCPWGSWPQEPTDGNEHERHSWSVDVKDMQELGLSVFTVGKPDQENIGEIVAVG